MSARICHKHHIAEIRENTHPLLEQADLLFDQGIGFGNDGNQVDLLVKSPHELDIDWFEPSCQLIP